MSDTDQTVNAVQTGNSALRVPSHGKGFIKPPFMPGAAPNPFGRASKYAQVRKLGRDAAPQAMRDLIELTHSPDHRVRIVAIQTLFERSFGKPKEYDPNDDKPPMQIDLSSLSTAELKTLLSLVRQTVSVSEAPEPDVPEVEPVVIEARPVQPAPPPAPVKKPPLLVKVNPKKPKKAKRRKAAKPGKPPGRGKKLASSPTGNRLGLC